MRVRRRTEIMCVIEEPRRLGSRLMRREPAATPVIEEPRQFSLPALWEKLAGEPGCAQRFHRQITIAWVLAAVVLSILRFSGIIAGFSADTLLFVVGLVCPAVEKGRAKRRNRLAGKRPVDRP